MLRWPSSRPRVRAVAAAIRVRLKCNRRDAEGSQSVVLQSGDQLKPDYKAFIFNKIAAWKGTSYGFETLFS